PEQITGDRIAHNVIDMYPTFVGQSTSNGESKVPAVNDIVWVDFGNRTNLTDPIYIKPAKVGNVPPSTPSGPGGQSAFGGCINTLQSITPNGDAIAGKNKALSHTGLPFLPRQAKNLVSQEYTFVKGPRVSPAKFDKWEKAIKSRGIPGRTWMGMLASNGIEDPSHPEGKRDTIIFSPNTTDFTLPVELMFFFHGLKEFGDNYDFNGRHAPNMRKLSEQGRNFVFIFPELAWSIGTIKPESRGFRELAWKGRDNFANFYREVTATIKESFSDKLKVGYISVTAHSQGGAAAKTAAVNGQFESVKVNKITFADGSYGNYSQSVYDFYVSKNPDVELNILVQTQGAPNKHAKELMSKIVAHNTNVLFREMPGLNHRQVGDMGLLFINDQKTKEVNKEADKLVTSATVSDDQEFIANQEPVSKEEAMSQKKKYGNKLPQQGTTKPPIPKDTDVSPSAITKNMGTPKASSAKIVEAKPFQEMRVLVSDYGGVGLAGGESVLIPIPSVASQQYAHVLLVKRFMLLNDLWMKENPGQPEIRVASGFRKDKWKSYEQYQQAMIEKYGSVEEGRKWKAFSSPHSLGLAIDIGNLGLSPNKDAPNIEVQKQTRLHKWLSQNMYKFGFSEYFQEPWHIELRIPRESWASGNEFVKDNNYAIYVINPGQGSGVPSVGPGNFNCVKQMGNIGGDNNLTTPTNTAPGKLASDKKKALIVELSNQLGVDPILVAAFAKVESGGGDGFDPKTKKMIIRFEENHLFVETEKYKSFGLSSTDIPWYDNTRAGMKAKWKQIMKENGWASRSQANEYAMMEYSLKVNSDMTYKSVSAGQFQVMCVNYSMFGYKSAKEMFDAFAAGEENQIRGFFSFIAKKQSRGYTMLNALKAKDFLLCAQLYNGFSTQAPLYASKIEKNYNKGMA
ncbi:MAG: D-alanyl-D-alanine carboxypeptidase family protein, partial [Magnetococcus sp. WYHC-3]